jgi:hypothetical protein
MLTGFGARRLPAVLSSCADEHLTPALSGT